MPNAMKIMLRVAPHGVTGCGKPWEPRFQNGWGEIFEGVKFKILNLHGGPTLNSTVDEENHQNKARLWQCAPVSCIGSRVQKPFFSGWRVETSQNGKERAWNSEEKWLPKRGVEKQNRKETCVKFYFIFGNHMVYTTRIANFEQGLLVAGFPTAILIKCT